MNICLKSAFLLIIFFYSILSCQNRNKVDKPDISGIVFFDGINENKKAFFYTEYFAQFHYDESDSSFYPVSYPLCEGDLKSNGNFERFELSGFLRQNDNNSDCIQIFDLEPYCQIDYSVDLNRQPVLEGDWFLVGIQENNEVNFTPCYTRRVPYLIFSENNSSSDPSYQVFGLLTGNVLHSGPALFFDNGNFAGEFIPGFRGTDAPEFDDLLTQTLNESSFYSINHNILTFSDTLNNRKAIFQKGSNWIPD
ncbi:MAG TPA: hypothetical protein DF712_05715 [Balneola sp.]|nr:hypothetical protein [Bacteroidota bacterium]HCI71036.1 hypothetical protein [Balneola sp.]HCT51939.1 hypothetical protein [Balneola sp.]|tara:strand:+ start:53178 stop:53930 length:753 start_codon:yes stop_codon:yes gene_type:complete